MNADTKRCFAALLRKQRREQSAFLNRSARTGKQRTQTGKLAFGVLYGAIALVLMASFASLSWPLAQLLLPGGWETLYFLVLELLALLVSVLAGALSSYNRLFQAKDNDLLLALPIPPWMIFAVRLWGLYEMSLFYLLLVWVPAEAAYARFAPHPLGGILSAVPMALLLAGVTGLTPSVLRAATAVWVSALGVWLYGPPDALTSLGVAGVWMTLGNSYAVCDIGFELSFAAVLGTLAGAELARKGRRFPLLRNSVWETLCVSACASAATFPVLVLRGLSASLYALVSSVAVLWLVEPILRLGLATALLGCWPALAPLHRVCSLCAATLAGCLNRWALWVSGWPGAQIYFDTACAALICLLLLGLGWLAYHWRVRPRVALPCLVLTAALAIGLGNVLNREIVRVELAGSRNAPAVVITRGESAVVLFRGGSSTQQAVETLLTRRGAREVEMLVDLRMNPRTPCTLEARERMEADEMPRYTTRRAHSSPAELEVLRVQNGCIVRITAAGRQFVALSGSVPLAKPVRVDWLLASPARPDAVRYTDCLTLSSAYRWMEEDAETETASCLALRPGGGERLL